MKTKIFFLVASLFITLASSAQDLFPLKRKPFVLNVAIDKKHTYHDTIPESEYLLGDLTCQLYVGETIFIEIEQENGTVKNVRAVAENRFPAKTVVVSFHQQVKKKTHESVMLKIQNPFPYQLNYDVKTYLVNYKKWVNVKGAPVEPGLSSYEVWPELISAVSVGDWAFSRK